MTTLREITAYVAHRYDLRPDDLTGPSRLAELVRSRYVAIRACRELTRFSMPIIGRHFNRDHTTILHALRYPLAQADLRVLEDTLATFGRPLMFRPREAGE
jgi:chromosomal replication initiation ATPase DnaA